VNSGDRPDRVAIQTRIEAVVERFKEMRDDIDKERKFMTKA
jgi:hypothetical protein